MRSLHVFRPTAFDTLEDRVVMATGGATAVSGLNLSDVLLVRSSIDAAFSEFRFEVNSAISGAVDFAPTPPSLTPPTTPPTVNPVIAPRGAALPGSVNATVSNLAQRLSDTMSPLRRSTRALIPAMLATVSGPGAGSLRDKLSATIGQILTAFNATQGPNTNAAQNAAIQQASSDLNAFQTQLSSDIAAAEAAVENQLNLFVNTPQGQAGRRARLDLARAQAAVDPAYNTFQSGLTSAIATYQTGLTAALGAIPAGTPAIQLPGLRNTALINATNTLNATIIGLTNTLNSNVNVVINSTLRPSAAKRVAAAVRDQIIGSTGSSLLGGLTNQLSALTLPSTGNTFSTTAFTSGTNNLVAQSRLTTASLLSVGGTS